MLLNVKTMISYCVLVYTVCVYYPNPLQWYPI